MIRALWIASTGMQAQQFNVDNIANNLANVNTPGFKKGRADFQDLLYQTLRPAGAEVAAGLQIPTGIQLGHGVRLVAIQKIFSQGDFKETQNPLDLVIEGRGFFQILLPNGEIAYTRSGAFKLDSSGNIVTSDGYLLQPPITIPPDTVSISVGSDGTVSVMQGTSPTPTVVGNIELATFPNPAGLKAIGRNLFMETEASGSPITGTPGEDQFGTIAQGFLEMSNVSVVEEMVNLIAGERAYEINGKAIQTSDEMLRIANNLRR